VTERAVRRALAVTAAALFAAGPARAADEAAPRADALFDEGVRLIKAGKFADACPKLEESKRLAAGLGVTLYLAACYEEIGKTASAYAQFVDAERAAHARRDDREKAAHEHAAALAPKLTKIVLRVPEASRVGGLVVAADGAALSESQWGAEIPVDPGAHEIRATAAGRRPWRTSVEASGQGAVLRVDIPPLDEADAPPSPVSGGAVVVVLPPPEPARGARDGRTQRIAGAAALGAGVAALAAGAFFGLRAKSKLDDSNAAGHCSPDDTCDATGLALRSDGQKAATLSTIAVIGGAAAIAGGAVLFFTAPRAPGGEPRAALVVAPGFGPGEGGVVARGGF